MPPVPERFQPERLPDPCAIVIFGASGDLTHRKLLPALFRLVQAKLLGNIAIIGVARTPMSREDFCARVRDALALQSQTLMFGPDWERFASSIHYLSGDLNGPALYQALRDQLAKIDAEHGTQGNRLFYCATPPSAYLTVVQQLGAAGLSHETNGWARIIIEKPFGRDVQSAQSLNREVLRDFRESQVYRIDHYLGKETVQNILIFRFANGIFEPLWSREHIDHVQITVAESMGVQQRGAYYEEAGALRDIIQNHILQLLCLVAMEPPVTFDADPVRDEKFKVMQAVRPISPEEMDAVAVRGQYGPGSIDGRRVEGYRSEKGVAPNSRTETYAALKLHIDNWRWADVPFYLRTGKRLPRRMTEIVIQFKRTPHFLFRSVPRDQLEPNLLILRIQPDEGISLQFGAKVPGPDIKIQPVMMDFRYGSSFGLDPPEAYERLLLDAMRGDATLYARADWSEAAWGVVEPILRVWEKSAPPTLPNYEAGSCGPPEADALIERDGRHWHLL